MRAVPDTSLARLCALLRQLLEANDSKAAKHVLLALDTPAFEQAILGAMKVYLKAPHTRDACIYRLKQHGHRVPDRQDEDLGTPEAAQKVMTAFLRLKDAASVSAREKLWMSVLVHADEALAEQLSIKIQIESSYDDKRKYGTIPVEEWTAAHARRALFQHFVAGFEEDCGRTIRLDGRQILGLDPHGEVHSDADDPHHVSRGNAPNTDGDTVATIPASRDFSIALTARMDVGRILQDFGTRLRADNADAHYAAYCWYSIVRDSDEDKINQRIARIMMRRDGKRKPSPEVLVAYTRDVVATLLAYAEAKFNQFLAARGFARLSRGDIKKALRS